MEAFAQTYQPVQFGVQLADDPVGAKFKQRLDNKVTERGVRSGGKRPEPHAVPQLQAMAGGGLKRGGAASKPCTSGREAQSMSLFSSPGRCTALKLKL